MGMRSDVRHFLFYEVLEEGQVCALDLVDYFALHAKQVLGLGSAGELFGLV
jgi:hypothetical protein